MDETSVRLRGLAADFERLIHVYEEKVSTRDRSRAQEDHVP